MNLLGIKINLLLSFKYEDNTLYSKNPITGKWEKGNLIEEYNNKTIQNEDKIAIYKITNSIKKVSDDEFIMTNELETIAKEEKYNSYNSKLKNETVCTRIK